MRKLLRNKDANVQMVGAVVGILITLIIAVLVFYTISGSLAPSTTLEQRLNTARGMTPGLDEWNNTTSIANSTGATLDQAATFFTIAPIIAIVVVAVVILGYVSRIGG